MISDDLIFVPAELFTRRYQALFTKKARVEIPVGWVTHVLLFLQYFEAAELDEAHKIRRIEMAESGALSVKFTVREEDIELDVLAALYLMQAMCEKSCIHDGSA